MPRRLGRLAGALDRDDVRFVLAHVHQPVIDVAARAGVLDQIGRERLFPHVDAARRSLTSDEP
jgi:hypothetical protein